MTGRRHHSSGDVHGRLPRRTRPLVVGGTIVAIVVVAAGVAFVLGGGVGGGALPTIAPATAVASPGFSDLPLETIGPSTSPAGTLPPVATGSPQPSATPLIEGEAGIRATRIKITRLAIDLAIIQGDGIDAPIGKAAHFPSTAWPDGGSNIYIYGHARKGMFLSLWQARLGDEVELDLVDGTSRTYVVTKVMPEVPWDAVQYLDPTPTEQLTLQTSTSYFPTAPRFVVIAVPRT